MKNIQLLLTSILTLTHSCLAQMTDVAGGNHHTYLLYNGIVYSAGQDLHMAKAQDAYIGGKLGRPIDSEVLPTKASASLIAQADYNPSFKPVQGLEGLEIVDIASGQNDGAAITKQGKLYMWGPNNHGQLGLGDMLQRPIATLVPLPNGLHVEQVVIGSAHTLALMKNGELYGWGLNRNGVLGLGDIERSLVPTKVELGHDKIARVATGQNTHTLALTTDGRIYSCGISPHGALGHGYKERLKVSTLRLIDIKTRFKAIGVGVHTSFAIDLDGQLYGWGSGSKVHFPETNADGTANITNLRRPTKLENAPKKLVSVAAGSRHTVVVDTIGNVYTWGIHTLLSGQLGIGPHTKEAFENPTDRQFSKPQHVNLNSSKAILIDSMANNVFILTDDQRVLAWGQTAHGRLGDVFDSAHTEIAPSGKKHFLAYEPVEITVQGTRLLK